MIFKYTIICLMALIVLFVIHLLIIKASTISNHKTPSGLYSATDKVSLLTVNNFNENVYNSSSAWLVQFYNSWCGHCIKFSPIWKQLAASVYNWRSVVIIGAIDCADDQNSQLCRDYEIMGYPTVRYFPPFLENFTVGRELSKIVPDVSFLRSEIINQLQNTETKVVNWPDFTAINSDNLPSIWEKKHDQLLILVVEKDDSYIGRELILDLHDINNLTVRYTFNSDFAKVDDPLPQVLAIRKDLSRKQLTIQNTTREGVFHSVQSFLLSQGYKVADIEENNKDHVQTVKVKQSQKQLDLVNKLFIEDLESAFSYSLFHEVTLKPKIEGESMTALKTYLRVVGKYFPSNENVRKIVNDANEKLGEKSSITGGDLKALLNSVIKYYSPLKRNFVGCKGSTAKYRGYPCSVWMTFHTLTVQSYLDSQHFPVDNMEVLNAMAGYIKNFFGCQDCSEHFLEMSKTMAGNVTSVKDSVLWLWKAHNTVNQRLAGDLSEDPSFPKIQFPIKNLCPECRYANDSWREDKVFDYLINMYSNVYNVVSNSDGETVTEYVKSKSVSEHYVQKIEKEDGWNFSLSDVKTCIALYVLSACLLTVYTVRFFLKKSRRSRNHKYDFYNKA